MKKPIVYLFTLFFLISLHLNSQNDTIWFDSNWKETNKKEASFFRPEIENKGDGFWIVDYYINGQKQMEGLSADPKKELYDGQVMWYFENGNTFQIVHYQGGILNGSRKVYYNSGTIESEAMYKAGRLNGKWKAYYEGGNIKETGSYESGEKEGFWKTFYANGKIDEEGKYVFDKKVDVWKTHYYDGTEQNN